MIDLLAVVGGVGGFFLLSGKLELAERLSQWTQGYEHWQLDEIPLTLLVLSLGLLWFGWRRWRALKSEMQVRSQMEAQNHRLAQQLIALQESERRRIARELHDEFGQCCVAIKVDAALIARDAALHPAQAQMGAKRISDTADHLQGVLRGMLTRLRPIGLDDLGLVSSLQLLVENWEARHGIACRFQASGALDALEESCTMTLYRSVQEGLTNIAKHAQASQASVSLAQTAGNREITLTVCDNGVGLQPDRVQTGLGIVGMRERVSALGGRLALSLMPTGGTQLQVLLPVRSAA